MSERQRQYDLQLHELEQEIEQLREAMGSKELGHKIQGLFGGKLPVDSSSMPVVVGRCLTTFLAKPTPRTLYLHFLATKN